MSSVSFVSLVYVVMLAEVTISDGVVMLVIDLILACTEVDSHSFVEIFVLVASSVYGPGGNKGMAGEEVVSSVDVGHAASIHLVCGPGGLMG